MPSASPSAADTPIHPINERPVVFLAIEQAQADAILEGYKRYEYRRQPPAIDPPYRVLLYVIGDVQAVVGGFQTYTVIDAPLDELIAETAGYVPQSPSDIRAYFEGKDTGTALRVDSWLRYDEPVSLDAIREADPSFHPPQNFRYLRADDHAAIFELFPYDRGLPAER